MLWYQREGTEAWDQRLLDLAIKENPRAAFRKLPPEYCYIVGKSKLLFPELNPIILHTLGGLRFKSTQKLSDFTYANG